jgi:hypothetical protein
MAKVHLFTVHVGADVRPVSIEASTKRDALANLERKLVAEGIDPRTVKYRYGGVETGSVHATDLNIWALRQLLVGGQDARPGATATSFPNELTATSKPHVQRCVQAGLARVAGKRIELTELGKSILGAS